MNFSPRGTTPRDHEFPPRSIYALPLALWGAIFIVFPATVGASNVALGESVADRFLEAFLRQDPSLKEWVAEEEIGLSERLGITYRGAPLKCVIGFGPGGALREDLERGGREYGYRVRALGDDSRLLEMTVAGEKDPFLFHFRKGRWISPITHHARD